MPVRFLMFMAILINSLDLVATSIGIHLFGNVEGNPLLAPLVRTSWPAFVALKGVAVPLLILALYAARRRTPRLVTAGLSVITLAFTVALGQWLGWLAGVIASGGPGAF